MYICTRALRTVPTRVVPGQRAVKRVCVCVCVCVGAVVAGAMRRVDGAGQFVSEHSPMSQRESVALR